MQQGQLRVSKTYFDVVWSLPRWTRHQTTNQLVDNPLYLLSHSLSDGELRIKTKPYFPWTVGLKQHIFWKFAQCPSPHLKLRAGITGPPNSDQSVLTSFFFFMYISRHSTWNKWGSLLSNSLEYILSRNVNTNKRRQFVLTFDDVSWQHRETPRLPPKKTMPKYMDALFIHELNWHKSTYNYFDSLLSVFWLF